MRKKQMGEWGEEREMDGSERTIGKCQ